MTDFSKRLDEISEKTASGIRFADTCPLPEARIKSAMLQALDEFAKLEPSKAAIIAGREALRHTASNVLAMQAYRAMTAAMLAEIKDGK